MNKTENILHCPDVGRVRFVRNRRAKNLSIRINRQGEVRVTVPGFVSLKKAEAFLLSKKHWVVARLGELMPGMERTVNEGDTLYVRGKEITVELKSRSDNMEDAIWRILQVEARAYLPGRVDALARKHGFRISGVKIRKMKTRWGSCSAKNGINLNSWLVMLPDHLSDYVILHELVHTRYKDHSPGFWESLDRITGGQSKTLRKELRRQQIMSVYAE